MVEREPRIPDFSGTAARQGRLTEINSMCSTAARNWRTRPQKC
jgi:hypothetical protein